MYVFLVYPLNGEYAKKSYYVLLHTDESVQRAGNQYRCVRV